MSELDIETEEKVVVEPKKKKSHRKLKRFGIFLLILISILILVVGWFGFIPGVSDILGANTPRDLGVRYTTADYESYKQKTNASFLDYNQADKLNNLGEKLLFDGPRTIDGLKLSQEEITATVNKIGWLWMPISNAQVKISDNTVEISGNLNLKYMNEFIDFIGGVGYSESDISQAISWAKTFANSPAIYVKANASVLNDKLSLKLANVTIGRLGAPLDIAEKALSTGTSNAILKTDNLEAKSATLGADGSLQFSGTYPSIVYVRH